MNPTSGETPPPDEDLPRTTQAPVSPIPGRATGGPSPRGGAGRWPSWVNLVAGVGGAIAVFALAGELGVFSLAFVAQHLGTGVAPFLTSLEFTTFTFAVGFLVALGLGWVRAFPPRRSTRPAPTLGPRSEASGAASASGPVSDAPGPGARRAVGSGLYRWPLYGFASGYVAAIRGTPFFVQLLIVYYAIIFTAPRLELLGAPATYWAGFLALLFNTIGYQTEAFRGGFQSIDPGQFEAARAVGLRRSQLFGRLAIPQGLRLVTLPLANEWISNFKTATILSYIGIFELFDWSRTDIALLLARPVEALVMLTIFYLLVNVTLSRTITYIEKTRRIPGLGTVPAEPGLGQRWFGAARAASR